MADLGGLINNMVDESMRQAYTAIPAIVLGIKGGGQQALVDVQPLVSNMARDGDVSDHAAILNVPLQYPAGSKGGMVFPVQRGDQVLLVFSMRGIDKWKYGVGRPEAPSDFRFMDGKDAIAIPCVFPATSAMTRQDAHSGDYAVGDVVLFNGRGGNLTEIILKASGDVFVNAKSGKVTVNCVNSEVNASAKAVYNTPNFEVNCSSYKVNTTSYQVGTVNYSLSATGSAVSTGSFNMDGSFKLNGIAIESHGHIEQGDGNRVSNPVA